MSMTGLRAIVDIDAVDIDRFVKDPSTLVEVCREVVDLLDESSDVAAVAEQEAQLRAIAKAVEQLEKSGVTVPDPLRAEKTRLIASLAVHADALEALAQLADEFQDILRDLRDRLGRNCYDGGPEQGLRGQRRSPVVADHHDRFWTHRLAGNHGLDCARRNFLRKPSRGRCRPAAWRPHAIVLPVGLYTVADYCGTAVRLHRFALSLRAKFEWSAMALEYAGRRSGNRVVDCFHAAPSNLSGALRFFPKDLWGAQAGGYASALAVLHGSCHSRGRRG